MNRLSWLAAASILALTTAWSDADAKPVVGRASVMEAATTLRAALLAQGDTPANDEAKPSLQLAQWGNWNNWNNWRNWNNWGNWGNY